MDKPPAPYQADGLIPGEDWRRRLSEEIRRAVRVILVLSSTSIAKVGYVQNEFRLALEAMAYMPPNTRFAIPLLIEDCTPPDLVVGSISLANLQWTNLDEIEMDVFLNMVEADLGR
ncbi:TIR domain-containing protein [Stakelama pacifica]|uniref:TIR domain-containing protein n=2 Tax=Stakelama pacifica TaxID=517720 RepID=A0A4R6FBL7_9SPHN|nr:TIR domain-containing protein [Stakelama pacifica]